MKSELSVFTNKEDVNLYNAEPEHSWNSVWFKTDDIVYAYETVNRTEDDEEEGILIYLECGEEIIVQKSPKIIAMLDKKFSE